MNAIAAGSRKGGDAKQAPCASKPERPATAGIAQLTSSPTLSRFSPTLVHRIHKEPHMRGHRGYTEYGALSRSSSLRSPEALRASAHSGNDSGLGAHGTHARNHLAMWRIVHRGSLVRRSPPDARRVAWWPRHCAVLADLFGVGDIRVSGCQMKYALIYLAGFFSPFVILALWLILVDDRRSAK